MNLPFQVSATSIDQFESAFSCKITTLPKNVALVGWSAKQQVWTIAPDSVTRHPTFSYLAPATLHFLHHELLPRLGLRSFWTLYCFYDGWRERNTFSKNYRWVNPPKLDSAVEWRGAPGEIPMLSEQTFRIACYGAHRGDPSALLLPEAHYLARNHYIDLFGLIRQHSMAWHEKRPQAIFCAGNHGECSNYFPPFVTGRSHPRQYLQQLVESTGLPVKVHLGASIPQSEQLSYKYILDVDGYARTWDAWAWKMQSGSVVLSPDSPWESFFTRLFDPWVHFVPMANDFSDLSDKLAWCAAHDADCQQMAQQAKQRAQQVYALDYVADKFAEDFQLVF